MVLIIAIITSNNFHKRHGLGVLLGHASRRIPDADGRIEKREKKKCGVAVVVAGWWWGHVVVRSVLLLGVPCAQKYECIFHFRERNKF